MKRRTSSWYRYYPTIAAVAVGMGCWGTLAHTAAGADPIDFARDIEPILQSRCIDCHGPDTQEGGLRLDHPTPALAGGDSGPVLAVGKPGESPLLARVTSSDPDTRMPPDGDPLTAAEVDRLTRWIAEGAKWPADEPFRLESDHWAFQPIERPAPPSVKDAASVRNAIDQFVLAKLESQGYGLAPEADRPTLIKRLSYDLLGLPPTPEEVDAFVADDRPDAYERLVSRLLESPHFAERWARHWLDKARYADSDGYEKDPVRPHAWRYRDWVIQAIHDDMPFDRFTVEQLAGDLLPDATTDQQLATAFHRQTLTNTEGGTDQEQFRVEAIFDRVATTGTVWLGLTVGCAQCHSHKYDPLTQREYYRLFAFFDNGDETTTEVPRSPLAWAKYERDRDHHAERLQAARQKYQQAVAALGPEIDAWEAETKQQLASLTPDAVRFVEPTDVSATSKGKATLTLQEDGSILASGTNPASDTYTVEFTMPPDTPGAVTGLRVEALPHDSLPSKGPGRTQHGNFVLNEIRVARVDAKDPKKASPLTLHGATADFSQDGWAVGGAIDGDAKSGWAISPQMGKPHEAIFRLAEPLAVDAKAPTKLRVELAQDYGSQHTLGCFRLTVRAGRDAEDIAPAAIRDILAKQPKARSEAERDALRKHVASELSATKKLAAAVAKLEKSAPQPPLMDVRVIAQRTTNPRTTHVLRRGDFLDPGVAVTPGTPAVLHAFEARTGLDQELPDRLDLARWLFDEANPLTARVAVNDIWGSLFGEPLVRTPGDFGVRGERPTHPELLDWLATEYRRLGWSRKRLIALIVNSATYRQSSASRSVLADVDPRNELLHRQNRFRVEAEIVRDLGLAVSGLLSEKVGGPSVFPPMPGDVASLSYANNFRWKTSEGEDRYRRGMYTFFKRTAPHPNLTTFDCPDSNTTNVQRMISNTPLQALTLLNEQSFVESAQAFGKRMLEEDVASDQERLTLGFRRCVARRPTPAEIERLTNLLETARDYYGQAEPEAKELIGDYKTEQASAAESAAWVVVARILLNLDEFLTRE